MKKKIFVGTIILCIMIVAVAILTACNNPDLGSQSGQDQYGREYGNVYDIDSYQNGIYALEYSIEDTSAMGKSMIGSYCYDKVKLSVTGNQYELTFYCKNTSFSDVKLNDTVGNGVEESDMHGFKFEVSREDLNDKLAMSGKVALMNKDVAFSIRLDLTKAVLIGDSAINTGDEVSGNSN